MKIENFTDKMYERINKKLSQPLSKEALDEFFEGSESLDKALAVYNANKDTLGGKKALKTAYKEIIKPEIARFVAPLERTNNIHPINLDHVRPIIINFKDFEDPERFQYIKNNCMTFLPADNENFLITFIEECEDEKEVPVRFILRHDAQALGITLNNLLDRFKDKFSFYHTDLPNINAAILTNDNFATTLLSLQKTFEMMPQPDIFKDDFLLIPMSPEKTLILGKDYIDKKEELINKIYQQSDPDFEEYFDSHLLHYEKESDQLHVISAGEERESTRTEDELENNEPEID